VCENDCQLIDYMQWKALSHIFHPDWVMSLYSKQLKEVLPTFDSPPQMDEIATTRPSILDIYTFFDCTHSSDFSRYVFTNGRWRVNAKPSDLQFNA